MSDDRASASTPRSPSARSPSSRAPTAPCGIYVCGPTVYGRIHIGNARPFVVFLVLKRYLERRGTRVRLVSNLTDVNDKIYDAAKAEGVPSDGARAALLATPTSPTPTGWAWAGPDAEPRVTETIPEIIALIADAGGRTGLAYAADGDVYYRVERFPGYGRLSGRRLDEMISSEPGHGEGVAPRLRPLEGAQGGRGHLVGLPVGPRAPGLAHRVLGDGRDGPRPRLRGPRRRASTWSSRTTRTRSPSPRAPASGAMARIWMHNEMLELGDEKMSKSLGNIAPLVRGARPLARRDGHRVLPDEPLPVASCRSRRSGWPRPQAVVDRLANALRTLDEAVGVPAGGGPRPRPVADDRGGPRPVLPGPRRRLRHPRGLRRPVRDGARHQPRRGRRARRAPPSCARRATSWPSCSTCWASAGSAPRRPATRRPTR